MREHFCQFCLALWLTTRFIDNIHVHMMVSEMHEGPRILGISYMSDQYYRCAMLLQVHRAVTTIMDISGDTRKKPDMLCARFWYNVDSLHVKPPGVAYRSETSAVASKLQGAAESSKHDVFPATIWFLPKICLLNETS